jgi:hypothetical protein
MPVLHQQLIKVLLRFCKDLKTWKVTIKVGDIYMRSSPMGVMIVAGSIPFLVEIEQLLTSHRVGTFNALKTLNSTTGRALHQSRQQHAPDIL